MIHQYGRLSVAMTAFLLFCSCETDSYDTGDGNFSYLNADFVIAHTAGEKEIDYAVNDDDEKILLKPHITAQWATTPDSLYRALLYYNKVKKDGEGMRAFRISQVHVLQPKDRRDIENIITDPLTLQSVWAIRCSVMNDMVERRYFADSVVQHIRHLYRTVSNCVHVRFCMHKP